VVARADRSIALLSIHPKFAHAIMRGEKRVEFRRKSPRADTSHVVVYATAPISKVVGFFEVDGIEAGSPGNLWERFSSVGGIREDDFVRYYTSCAVGTAIRVGSVTQVQPPVPLDCIDPELSPPQSFRYLKGDALDLLAGDLIPLNPGAASL
jgi:predicted transcriptional regulator